MEPTSQLKKVKLFIHGTCTSDRFGPAGWACRLVCENVAADMSGSDPKSSVNRMFLRAAIEGLKALKQLPGHRVHQFRISIQRDDLVGPQVEDQWMAD